jgi:hypothetical protein
MQGEQNPTEITNVHAFYHDQLTTLACLQSTGHMSQVGATLNFCQPAKHH